MEYRYNIINSWRVLLTTWYTYYSCEAPSDRIIKRWVRKDMQIYFTLQSWGDNIRMEISFLSYFRERIDLHLLRDLPHPILSIPRLGNPPLARWTHPYKRRPARSPKSHRRRKPFLRLGRGLNRDKRSVGRRLAERPCKSTRCSRRGCRTLARRGRPRWGIFRPAAMWRWPAKWWRNRRPRRRSPVCSRIVRFWDSGWDSYCLRGNCIWDLKKLGRKKREKVKNNFFCDFKMRVRVERNEGRTAMRCDARDKKKKNKVQLKSC